MAEAFDLVGQIFERLIVLQRTSNDAHGNTMWECQCLCGNSTIVSGTALKRGLTRSCGCLKLANSHWVTHGRSNTKEYSAWRTAKQRCINPNNKDYESYGGRGITMCDSWLHSFENFFKDMGLCPSNLMLERKNNDGNYEPGNCKWATAKEQAANRRPRAPRRVQE